MSHVEFDALFAVMDADGSGTVDFLEFCAYMSMCKSDFNEAKDRKSIREVRASFSPAGSSREIFATETAQRYSSRTSLRVPPEVPEEEVEDGEKGASEGKADEEE